MPDQIFNGDISIEEALAKLRVRLLNLTSRNRLLNFKHSPGKSLQFLPCSPHRIYQRLLIAQNGQITILPVPEPEREEWINRGERLVRPDARDHARKLGFLASDDAVKAGTSHDLQTLYYQDEFESRCRKLALEAESAIAETGSNMLFVVLGFLEFPEQHASDRIMRAPLISIPVTMKKIKANDDTGNLQFLLLSNGEEIPENICLREKLKQTYSFEIPEFDGKNPEKYFSDISARIQQKPGWKVVPEVALALLPPIPLVGEIDPAKWGVDAEGKSHLTSHSIICKIFEGASHTDTTYANEHDIDSFPAFDIPLIYDADSSQHSALIDALSGRDLVIEGPPGTGKSQTITNLIAAAMKAGKKVLFVAEKMAALDVVKQNLSRVGLGHFCLELHSNKSQKKKVIDSIKSRHEAEFNYPTNIAAHLATLEDKRKALKAYSDLISSVIDNEQELTVHQIFWKTEKFRLECGESADLARAINIAAAPEITTVEFNRMHSLVLMLAAQYAQIGAFNELCPFWGFTPKDFLPGADLKVEDCFNKYIADFEAFAADMKNAACFFGGEHLRMNAENAALLLNKLADITPSHLVKIKFGLLPRIFTNVDPEGRNAELLLKNFVSKLAAVNTLKDIIGNHLISTDLSNDDTARALGLKERLGLLGLQQISCANMLQLAKELSAAITKSQEAIQKITKLCLLAGQQFDGSCQSVMQIAAIVNAAHTAPQALLHNRHQMLLHHDSTTIISRAKTGLDAILIEKKTLNDFLYLDFEISEEKLSDAILTLREGDAWYRIFQGGWRRACSLHKSLDRTKVKKQSLQRLVELERLFSLIKERRLWNGEQSYRDILGSMYCGEATLFDDALCLASWLTESRKRFMETGLGANESWLLTVDETLIVQLSPAKRGIDDAQAVLQQFDELIALSFGSQSNVTKRLQNENSWLQKIDIVAKLQSYVAGAAGNLAQWTGSPELPAIDVINAVGAVALLPDAIVSVTSDLEVQTLLEGVYDAVETDMDAAWATLSYGRKIIESRLPDPVTAVLLSDGTGDNHIKMKGFISAIQNGWQSVDDFSSQMATIGAFDIEQWVGKEMCEPDFADCLDRRCKYSLENIYKLLPWVQYLQASDNARRAHLDEFVQLLELGNLSPEKLPDIFSYRFYASISKSLCARYPLLAQFTGVSHEQIRKQYQEIDRKVIQLQGKLCAYEIDKASSPPAGKDSRQTREMTEMALLNCLMGQGRPRVTIRDMMTRAGGAIQALKPCFMMGPQAVAQYLAPGAISFDMVIMDEASQIRPEEALGSIARGKQLIVVGDPKQLPPTFDFKTYSNDGGGQGVVLLDEESILNLCIARFQPVRTLRWHYRSRHESLIAFSNHEFYRDNLVIFPSPYAKTKTLGVHYRHIPDAIYENQTNKLEAARIVDAVIGHILTNRDDSLGVVTLNVKQRDLIADLLEQRCRNLSVADEYKAYWEERGYPFFVKNLENVQGDERDVIYISTTFGPPPGTTVVRQNFGPISRQGGWRRLNVLFTRARKAIHVLSSMHPEDIVMDGGTPEGTRALRNYLEYARSGVMPAVLPTGADPDSDFEISVADVLRGVGYEVVPQLGVSSYRIDIAVKHPLYPESGYLAAIECDGATYHSAASVRDRDRIRQEIIESMGWKGRIWRIWSTDWFKNPIAETHKLVTFLEELKRQPLYTPEEADGIDDAEIVIPVVDTSDPVYLETYEESSEDLEVVVGDTVTYSLDGKSDEDKSVCITKNINDFESGFVAFTAPLAQIMLGAVVGDEVVLRVAGKPSKVIVIKKIVRNWEAIGEGDKAISAPPIGG